MRSQCRKVCGTAVLTLLLGVVMPLDGGAEIHHVRSGAFISLPPYDCWDNASATIQGALNVCGTGDTVLVRPGTYAENLVWPSVENTRLLSVDGAEATVIDGSGSGSVITISGINGAAIGAQDHGFTIQNGTSVAGGGISIDNSTASVAGNMITYNFSDDGGGIRCYGASMVQISDNEISNNAAIVYGGGISVREGASVIVERNIIRRDSCGFEGGGMFI